MITKYLFLRAENSSLLLTQAPVFLLTIYVFSFCLAVHLPTSTFPRLRTTPDIFCQVCVFGWSCLWLLPFYHSFDWKGPWPSILEEADSPLTYIIIEFPAFTCT